MRVFYIALINLFLLFCVLLNLCLANELVKHKGEIMSKKDFDVKTFGEDTKIKSNDGLIIKTTWEIEEDEKQKSNKQ